MCYFAIKKESLDVDKVNLLANDYFTKYGISKTDTIKRADEIGLLLDIGNLNKDIGNNEKFVFYYSLVKKNYEENNIIADKDYVTTLILLSDGYYKLKDYNSAIEVGQVVWKINLELFGEKTDFSLRILDILYSSYENKKEMKKAVEFLSKYVEIGKEVLGESDLNYISSLLNLGMDNAAIGNYKEAVMIGLQVVKLRKEVLGEKHPDYISSLYFLSLSYSDNGEYSKALEIILKVVELRKELLGEKHPNYLNSLNHLAWVYYNLFNYQKSLEINLKLVELKKEVLGEKNPDYLVSLSNLASAYSTLGDYPMTLKIYLKVVDLSKALMGEKHQDYTIYLQQLAFAYSNLGEYKKGIEIQLNVVELRKEVCGEKHPNYYSSIAYLARLYSQSGDYTKALEIDLRAVEFGKQILGGKHPDYLTSLNFLASIYAKLGDYKKALTTNLKVVELRKEVFGEKHPIYLSSLTNLASVYIQLGDYPKALEINLKVNELFKEILGERNPVYLTSLGALASNYAQLGDNPKALKINLQVTELQKEILGERNPAYLNSLGLQAIMHYNLGDYLNSLEVNLKDSELFKEVLGEKHPQYLAGLGNIALVYSALGDYQKSLDINLKVVELSKEVLGEKHPNYLVSLNNLALAYSETGDNKKALEIDLRVVELGNEVLGEKHPDQLSSLANLAIVYSKLGENKKALEIMLKVTELSKEILGEKHPGYLSSLYILASIYSKLGDYTQSIEINRKVEKLAKEILGINHPLYSEYLINIAVTEFNSSDNISALGHYLQMLNFAQERVVGYFGLMTEQQRELFWKKYSRYFMLFPKYFEKVSLSNPKGTEDAYDISLFSKGLLLNTTLDFEQLIAEKGNPDVIAKFEELKLIKLQIQRILEKPVAERSLNVDSLENLAQKKETELVKLSKEYGDYTRNLKINWKDVQSNLQEKDIAIEFVEYPTLTDTVKYAALVLRKGWDYPKMIPLFRKDQIEEFINQDKSKIYSKGIVGKQIKKLVWDPIGEVVAPGDRIYFSAAGVIHQLAIENLPANDSLTLGDLYEVHRLSSTKELAIHQPEEKRASAVLYGGLNYAMEIPEMKAESKKYEPAKNNSYLAMRGYRSDSTLRKGWSYLEGTLTEVEKIGQLMQTRKYSYSLYTGSHGNEESFKSLSGKKNGIIHIATHGFFLPVEESRKNLFIMQRMEDQPQEKVTADPMLRSGLMLSGGNRAWQGEKVSEEIEDGVLTAKEISRMDLRGTDLVVLSACETGLGDVSSEGVFGLQRSFKQAGVQTLLMSLWEVNDKATSFLMSEFYVSLLSGKDKRASFLEAKRKCKEKYPEIGRAHV